VSNLAPLDRGVRLVSATGQCQYDDDPSLPFRVYVNLRPPKFMGFTFTMLHGGSEEIVARAESLEWAEDFIARNDLETHPRFRRLAITGPDGVAIERAR
jgi:hypothetical protein